MVWEAVATLLVGLAKQGKTYLATQLALCLASGRPFLGLHTRQAHVLYMSWEITLAGLYRRMENISLDCDLPAPEKLLREGRLHFYAHRRNESAPRLDLGESADWPRLGQLLTDVKPDVVIIDTLRKACPGISLKDDQEWSRALQNFNAMARQTGISIILIDHGHRARTGETAAAFAMGSQVKGSELLCIVKLERQRREDEPDRWGVEIDSWFDDSGAPLWYERPELEDGVRGCGCVPFEAPRRCRPENRAQRSKWRLGSGCGSPRPPCPRRRSSKRRAASGRS